MASNPENDTEETPLLPSSTQQAGPLSRTFSNIRRKIAPWIPGLSEGTEDGKEADSSILTRQRSRLNSYPVVAEPDELKKFQQPVEVGDPELAAAEAAGEGMADAGVEPGPEAQEPDSKYIGITPGRFWLIFLTILLGYFVACFDTTLMASSHPVITSYFDASESASWLTTVFMITNTGFQPLWGRLSDTIGRKSVYLLVLTIFAVTNLWCAVSTTIGSFIAARAVCGLGAGGTMSMGLVIVNDLVSVEYRGIYVSHINIAFGLGSACGAAFGGVLCDSIGWRWSFGIQVPVIIVCALAALLTAPRDLGPMLIKKSPGESGQNPAWTALKNFDSSGIVVLVVTVTFLILFLNLGGNIYPWDSPFVIVSAIIAVLGSGLLIVVERRAKQAVMPLHLLWKPPIANLTFSNFLAGIASNTVLFNVPLWFQAVNLTSPTASGLRLAAPSIGGSLAGIFTGYIITWTRRLKPTLIFGAIVYVAGSIALCFIQRDMSTAASVALITPAPLAQGFIYPNTMMSAFAICEPAEQAVVTTTISLWRNLGIVVGVAVSSLVLQNSLRINLENNVTGPRKEEIIHIARSSVRNIRFLPKLYLEEVIVSYAAALKHTFLVAVVASVIMLIIDIPCKLPRLSRSKKTAAPAGD